MTRALFSTKSFVPGHILGTAMLLFGTIAMAKWLIARHRAQVAAGAPGGTLTSGSVAVSSSTHRRQGAHAWPASGRWAVLS